MIDVTRMSYYDLKRTALENVMRLEQLGRISKQNFYQDVLNAIAVQTLRVSGQVFTLPAETMGDLAPIAARALPRDRSSPGIR